MPPVSFSALVKDGGLGKSTSSIAAFKVREKHEVGMDLLRHGLIYDAIQLFQEASFFDAENIRPIVALAECYVFLCDLRSAVRCYRRALLSLHRKELSDLCRRESEVVSSPVNEPTATGSPLAHPAEHAEGVQAVYEDEAPTGVIAGHTQESVGSDSTTAAGSKPLSSSHPDDSDSPRPSDPDISNSLAQEETKVPLSDRAVPLENSLGTAACVVPEVTPHPRRSHGVLTVKDISTRLAGVLDALGLSLYQVGSVDQALRCTNEALVLLHAAAEKSRGKSYSVSLLQSPHLLADATISLHHSVYLMALQRDEEAESLLEKHFATFVEWRPQTSTLLIQLFCNRQAFRKARGLLEKQEEADAGDTDPNQNPTGVQDTVDEGTCNEEGGSVAPSSPSKKVTLGSLAVAKYLFTELYARYRTAALTSNNEVSINCCLAIYSNDVDLLYRRAQLKLAAGEHKKSVKDLFRVLRETNGEHKGAIEDITTVLFTIGSSLQGEAEMQDAVTYYSESLKWRPDNRLVLLARGDCYTKMESFEEALNDYEAALCLAPEQREAHQRIAALHDLWGRKLFAQNQPEQAEAAFTNAIKTDSQNPEYYYHRSLCRLKLHQGRYALRDVLSCKELNPTAPHLRAFIARYLEPVQSSEDSQRTKVLPMATKKARQHFVRAAPQPLHQSSHKAGRVHSPLPGHDKTPAVQRRHNGNMYGTSVYPTGNAPLTEPSVLPCILCSAASRKYADLRCGVSGHQTRLHQRQSGAPASVE